jgi:hypothetical protein
VRGALSEEEIKPLTEIFGKVVAHTAEGETP